MPPGNVRVTSRMSHFTATCGCALAEVAASAAFLMIAATADGCET